MNTCYIFYLTQTGEVLKPVQWKVEKEPSYEHGNVEMNTQKHLQPSFTLGK